MTPESTAVTRAEQTRADKTRAIQAVDMLKMKRPALSLAEMLMRTLDDDVIVHDPDERERSDDDEGSSGG